MLRTIVTQFEPIDAWPGAPTRNRKRTDTTMRKNYNIKPRGQAIKKRAHKTLRRVAQSHEVRVSEIVVNWTNGVISSPVRHDQRRIGEIFQADIRENEMKGFHLESWQLHFAAYIRNSDTLCTESIIAIFRN